MSDLEQDGGARQGGDVAASEEHRRGCLVRRFHPIYNPADLTRAIHELRGGASDVTDGLDDGGWDAAPVSVSLASEDVHRLRALERVAADRRGHQRRSIVGSPAMARRIEALSTAMPHFAPALDLVARAALVSARTASPIRLPPILLLGEPGIGKSYTVRRLAEAIGADFSVIAANITDAFRLRGLNTAWRGARMGRIAEALLGAATAPVILVDEFDKAVGDHIQRPYDVWHSLLERENAATFQDDFLEIDLRADHISWFASANDVSALPASIVDRMLVIEIPAPSPEQIAVIVASMYAACRAALGGALPEMLPPPAAAELARHSPRHISRLLDLAVGYAAAGGRMALNADDVRHAQHLADAGGRIGLRGPVGFTARRAR